MSTIELSPHDKKQPPDGVFEVGLVLAGAISAGAYIGGVMDYLIEALDTWESQKTAAAAQTPDRRQWSVPPHHTFLKIITGASGGAMNGALLAAALRRRFPHINTTNAPKSRGADTGNPFFDAWVHRVDIADFLNNNDLNEDSPLPASLLNCANLDDIAEAVFSEPPGAAPISRPWIDAGILRVFLAVSNLRGIPYSIAFRGDCTFSGHGLMAHADYMRFAIRLPGATGLTFPNERILTGAATQTDPLWKSLADAALASGAFPVALQPRALERPYSDYDAAAYITPEKPGDAPIPCPPTPFLKPQDSYKFLCVDGGTMNNEPVDMARRVLAGATKNNPRDGSIAKRAILLIDPFPEDPELGPDGLTPTPRPGQSAKPVNALFAFGKLTSAWKNQCRFKPADLELAKAENVFSRFLMTPSRGKPGAGPKGDKHIASGVLAGFGGFLEWEYRRHDYLLGRRNAERFLQEHFALPENNPLFKDWNPALRTKYSTTPQPGETTRYLPIIPALRPPRQQQQLGGPLAEEGLPAWPRDKFKVDRLEKPVKERFEALWRAAMNTADQGWLGRTYLWLLKSKLKSKAWDYTHTTISDDLTKFGL